MEDILRTPATDDELLLQCLNPLAAVVVAMVDREGRLMRANWGCRRILGIADDSRPLPEDIRGFFVHPSFDQLAGLRAEDGRPVYEGILNVGETGTHCRSLIGAVHRRGEHLLLVGEYDVAEMERLNAQVIELNEELAAIQRDLARSNRKLKESETRLIEISLTDPLTGLANRRRLTEFLRMQIERNRRYAEPFSVIMSDIDFFKNVNDGFGHEVGDEVLRSFSSMLAGRMRTMDLVARLGGEEFIIVMPNTLLAEAVAKAEQLRAEVERLYFESMQKGITASFGVADFSGAGDVDALLRNADKSVYASKQAGRNRVSAHGATNVKTDSHEPLEP